MIFVNAMNIGTNFSVLWMFNRGLWLLNKEMIKGFMKEHRKHGHVVDNTSTSAVQDLKVVVDEYNNDGKDVDASVVRIIRLYNLMKKQTILVCIPVVSMILLGIWTGIDSAAIYEFGWVLIINMICLWMMLSTSKRYWNLCKDYGCCVCCYQKT